MISKKDIEKKLRELEKNLGRLYSKKQKLFNEKDLYEEDDKTYLDRDIAVVDQDIKNCENLIYKNEQLLDNAESLVETTYSNAIAYAAVNGVKLIQTNIEDRLIELFQEETGFVSRDDNGTRVFDFTSVEKYVELTNHDLSNDTIIEHLNSTYSYMHEGGFRVIDMDLIPGQFKICALFESSGQEFDPSIDYKKMLPR